MPSQTFTSTGGWGQFAVPKNVDRVTVDVKGGGSGTVAGGRVQGQIKVQDDDVLFILVGEAGKGRSGKQGGASAHGGGGPGGDASTGNNGGAGGGGASAIRLNSTDGTIKCVGGGAGGKSGDNGDGGAGGAATGEHGHLGTAGAGTAGNATGGTQIQGGDGGASSAGTGGFDGENGDEHQALGTGGRGGQQITANSHGGGGGGGGWRAGGGGCAALIGTTPGGGGGGGSNYTGGLFTGVSSGQGSGGTGDGVVVISWVSPAPANQPPGSPSEVKVDGVNETPGMGTKSTGTLTISAILRDSDSTTVGPTHTGGAATQQHAKARLVVRYSTSRAFSHSSTEHSDYVEYGKRAEVVLRGLAQNTHYYMRLYAQDAQGLLSQNYNAVDLWTNRPPTEPDLQAPGDNVIIADTDSTTFDWRHNDPDPNDSQTAFEFRWRRASLLGQIASPWQMVTFTHTAFDNYTVDPGEFVAGNSYDWTVRTRDEQGAWGPTALPRTFTVLGTSSAPLTIYPVGSQAVDASGEVTFTWRFRDPDPGAAQVRADLRYRVYGTTDWVVVVGDTTIPGGDQSWTFPVNTFAIGDRYEWQVRTNHDTDPIPSDWSDSALFWTHGELGSAAAGTIPEVVVDQGALGCGTHRVFIYDRGGVVLRGEVTPLTALRWTRRRDDLGDASITTGGFGDDCGELLKTVHTWLNELVIFRDGVRVFEGPITLIEDAEDGFKIEAKDVMGYVYRRIMRQGYNDSYHLVNGVKEGLLTVVERAGLIIADALARNDPNVLPYLTLLVNEGDARESRVRADYSMSAWEEVDDLAANAGLDYSVVGRRIILNDTHRPIGRLGEMRSENFASPPKVTEYGMLLSDYYAVTNNAGIWGAVDRPESPYGGIELLVSSFSEVGGAATETLTKGKQEELRKVLVEQAKRGIASRYPAPYIVRVPDGSALTPDTPVGINQLVPGVWIPLRATGTLIEVSQWQKLDVVEVIESEGVETVSVTMSPAPNQGQDPDADTAAAEAAV